MAENKTKPTDVDPREYIAGLEPERRRDEAMEILKLYERVTGKKAVMWGPTGIAFGFYSTVYESGRKVDMGLASFAPRKANLVCYALTGFRGQKELLAKLGKHKTGKVCLYINKLADVDIDVLEDIIQNSFNHMSRVKEKEEEKNLSN